MQPGDLARIIQPSFTFGDSQLIIDAWHGGKPVLILKESSIKYTKTCQGLHLYR